MPAYNVAWCVGRAVDSVLAQDFRGRELIVVNDGSTDGTRALLEGYGAAITVIDQDNRGMSAARNAGIRRARGTYVAFLDADDWWLPGKLVASGRTDAEPSGDRILLDRGAGRGRRRAAAQSVALSQRGAPRFSRHYLPRTQPSPAAARRSWCARTLFDRVGLFDESLRGFEDPDLWMRLAAVSGYACIDETLAVILRREKSVSRNLDAMRVATLRSMRKNRALLPARLRGRFWRNCLAGVYTDYAKPAYRAGRLGLAYADTLRALMLSPLGRGRLCLGLLRDFLLKKPV